MNIAIREAKLAINIHFCGKTTNLCLGPFATKLPKANICL